MLSFMGLGAKAVVLMAQVWQIMEPFTLLESGAPGPAAGTSPEGAMGQSKVA
jgi:hypothetical protein